MNTKAILNQMSPEEALTILKTLAENDPLLAERIAQMAHENISEVDEEDIAAEVYRDLDGLEVEDVWDQAGATRHGYVETDKVADEMIQGVWLHIPKLWKGTKNLTCHKRHSVRAWVF